MNKPLDGLRFLDFGTSALAAVCCRMLGAFGAEIIKVEADSNIAVSRSSYAAQNAGKMRILLDFSQAENIPYIYDLLSCSNGIITDNPDFINSPDFCYDALKARFPSIVYTCVTPYGTDGPFSARTASDQTVQAESGIMSITGEEHGTPVVCGAPIADYLGSSLGCIGTLMAIADAVRTGNGRFVDVSALDSLIFGLENQFSVYLHTGQVPGPIGNNYRLSAPVGVFPCKDGALTISVATQTQWHAFAEALEHTEWLENPLFATIQNRIHNYREVSKAVREAFSLLTYHDLTARLQSRHCIYGRINTLEDVLRHPQTTANHTFTTAAYPDGDTYTVPAVPVRMDGVEPERITYVKYQGVFENSFPPSARPTSR